METMLDLPTITGLPTDPVSTAIAAQVTKPTATLKETALASFVPIEAHMRTLAARYKDVAYDVTTTKGMADAELAAANGPEVESDSTPPAVVEPATLKIGAICTRLGITITAAFLHGKGIEPAGRDKAAVLYRESQWPVIKAALIRHIEAA